MNIALISPKSAFLSENTKFKEFWQSSDYIETYKKEWSGLSPALTTIAALTPQRYTVEIIDENLETIDYNKKYDIVGITCMTQQAKRAYKIADQFRKNGVNVVIGGIHATLLPDEAKMHVDSVVIGEAENLWGELLFDFEHTQLKPFYKSERLVNLDSIPTPRYELLKGKGYPVFWIQASRGCPHDCCFCAASKVYGFKYRNKNIEQVIDEVKKVKKLFPNKRISFSDDNMFVKRRYSKELLRQLTPLNIRYMAQTDISIAEDDELLNLMKKSGCTFVLIGFESLSPENLEYIDIKKWKAKKLSSYETSIKKIQSHGIGVMGAFIIGLENDDHHVFQNIAEFIKKNYLYNANIGILTPFPGTGIREKLQLENKVLSSDWSRYTLYDVNFVHKNLTKKDLEIGLLKIYKSINNIDYFYKKLIHFKNIYKKSNALTADQ